MSDVSVSSDSVKSDVEPMVAVYRHDVHKARSRSHEHAEHELHGVRVNEPVPHGADADAALLSRPRGEPEQTVDAHESWYRLSLLTGQVVSTTEAVDDVNAALRELVECEDAETLHAAWVESSVPALFSESPYYPYTSLKFHTLLAAALLDNYRSGFEFDELFLAVTPRDAAREIVPHQTVLATPGFALHVTGEPDGRPAAQLGDVPARSFADTWARLPELPFDVDASRLWRVLDAQLRRVRSWSVALQYVEEFVAAFEPESNSQRRRGAAESRGGRRE
ncbi:hypothetical protein HTZ84_11895 [Haloterrigena sp. SYSU A558-1]|uniref:DUF8168 domain-containing protein n=1 Tax=Haloterrigena gelatinilytica TaxID=2741724 RepID=A0ABX2LIU3_9EURY|nr:hypothetical protein [Haloterrigena gelatinilytica]NUC73004.1 hypothetical protein [Haloterrigena gelatinilytica]